MEGPDLRPSGRADTGTSRGSETETEGMNTEYQRRDTDKDRTNGSERSNGQIGGVQL